MMFSGCRKFRVVGIVYEVVVAVFIGAF